MSCRGLTSAGQYLVQSCIRFRCGALAHALGLPPVQG